MGKNREDNRRLKRYVYDMDWTFVVGSEYFGTLKHKGWLYKRGVRIQTID